jgi:hypothetical protein
MYRTWSVDGIKFLSFALQRPNIQGDQKVSLHLMITVQKTPKHILNSFNHLP